MKLARNPFHGRAGAMLLALLLVSVSNPCRLHASERRPNVVIVMTDDQGYGDLGCHGHPFLKTPNLDKLHHESVRLTDFHVMPLCAPTRAMLMTGRDALREGVWATVLGRSILPAGSSTMATHFAANGYATGMFGKWHLGDNYPARPHDKGFQKALYHGGGGVGQTPDYWGNDYLNDTYFLSGKPVQKSGYCTDVWFESAFDFIRENRQKPFLAYIATNAPHSPYIPPPELAKRYQDVPGIDPPTAAFYAMIENIDTNMGRLMQLLTDQDLERDTILLFMTDNGTAQGLIAPAAFNAGMKGSKGTLYEGGHRVPCFIRWPGGQLPAKGKGRDCQSLTSVADLLPTLASLCGLQIPAQKPSLDGLDLSGILKGQPQPELESRTLFIQYSQTDNPPEHGKGVVLTPRWRWINHRELYDMKNDPGEIRNVMKDHPDVVERLSKAYDAWFGQFGPVFRELNRIRVGSDHENPCRLNAMDWHTGGTPANLPWNQAMIRKGLPANGYWAIDVECDGVYELKLMRWPEESKMKMTESPEKGGRNWPVSSARLMVGEMEISKQAMPGDKSITLELVMQKGPKRLKTEFLDIDGKSLGGASYVVIHRKSKVDR